MASFALDSADWVLPPATLGPRGPFPRTTLSDVLERRWLHYAFLSLDRRLAMVANACLLGPSERESAQPRFTTLLLAHDRNAGWSASQFNADVSLPPWSAFAQPHPINIARPLHISSVSGEPAVRLDLARTGRPCTSQCAPFDRDQYLRWQSEAGIRARGYWRIGTREYRNVEAIGYHERVRGRWAWPALGEWVFGFANDAGEQTDAPPMYAVVFTFIQPRSAEGQTTASLMLWRHGRMCRQFPRRNVSMAARGKLDRTKVCQVPALSRLFGVPPMASVPHRLIISARLGPDWAVVDFEAETAARIVIPSEDGIRPFSVHEVVGMCEVHGELSHRPFEFEARGIVEFAGGASGD